METKCEECMEVLVHQPASICTAVECFCGKHYKPSGEVEEKIRRIWVGCDLEEGVKRLLELVRMARKGA